MEERKNERVNVDAVCFQAGSDTRVSSFSFRLRITEVATLH